MSACNLGGNFGVHRGCIGVAWLVRICLRNMIPFALAVFLLFQFGCGSNNIPAPKPPSNSEGREWTVMVYMSADDKGEDSLEPDAIDDLNEMELVGSDDKLAIVIQLDRVPGRDSSNGDWVTTCRYFITYDPSYDPNSANPDRTIRSKLIADLGELNMGSPKTLIDFVKWAKVNYPAKHYALVLWNHGRGIDDSSPYRLKGVRHTAQFSIFHPRGIIYDDTDEDFLTIPELGTALNEVKPIDVVAFDACLMGMVEVAYEIRNAALFMCASQLSPPNEGYRYDLWLGELKRNPTMGARELSKVIVEKYVKSVGRLCEVANSAIALPKVAPLASAISSFADELQKVADKYKFELANAREETTSSPDYRRFRDLYDYARKVKEYVDDQNIRSHADEVMERLKDAVVLNMFTGDLENLNGLSIYLPSPGEANLTSIGYTHSAFAKDTSWDEWLTGQKR